MAELVFEDLGGDTRQSLEGFWKQWAKNFRVRAGEKGDKKFNPRGLGTQLATGLGGPGIGLASSIPFAMLAKNLLGKKGSIADLLGIGKDTKFGVFDTGPNADKGGEPLSGQFTEGGSPLSGQFSSQDGSNADIMAALGLPTDTLSLTSKASPLGGVDLSKILFDSAVAGQATTPDTFDRTDFATQALQAFTAAQNDALVNQYGGQGGSISNNSSFLSDPNSRIFGGLYDEVGAALAARHSGGGGAGGRGRGRFLR